MYQNNRDKQIEEMANDLVGEIEYDTFEHLYSVGDSWTEVKFDYTKTAEHLIDKGYRKASDVAREIFEEIEQLYMEEHEGCEVIMSRFEFAELRKKYESEGEG